MATLMIDMSYLDYLFLQLTYAYYQICDFHLMMNAVMPTQQLNDAVHLKANSSLREGQVTRSFVTQGQMLSLYQGSLTWQGLLLNVV